MQKIIIAMVLVAGLVTTIAAQSNLRFTPVVTPTQGGSTRVGNLQLDYTIGEPAQKTLRNGNLVFSQGFEQPENTKPVECDGVNFIPSSAHIFCSPTSTDWTNKYRLQTSYIPDGNTPIKYYNINFVILQKTNLADRGNFEDIQATQDYLDDVVDYMNEQLSGNTAPTDPQTAICGTCFISDTRIRIVNKGVHFIIDDALYNSPGIANGLLPNPETELSIVLIGESGGHIVSGAADGPSIDIDIIQDVYVRNVYANYLLGNISWPGNLILHELGHTWGLMHLYGITCCPEDCNNANIDYLADIFGPGPNTPCWQQWGCDPTDASVFCTNGFMSASQAYPLGVNISNYQLGRIHRNLQLRSCRKYACGYGNTPYEVSTDETWDFDIKFYQDIVVKEGVTLTVTCRLNMVPGSHIIVEAGAKLFVDGGTITSAESSGCTGRWGGIIIQGHKNLPQDFTTTSDATAMSENQGFVYLKDAVIEHAQDALRVWNVFDGWVSQWTPDNIGGTGGIVRAVNSQFINNHRSAEFMWYRSQNEHGNELPNLSYFFNCDFITNNDFIETETLNAQVTAWGVRDLRFWGCRFENARTISSSTTEYVLGSGIRAIDAGIIVTDCPPSLSITGSTLIRSKFTKLQHGVHVANTNSLHRVRVFDAQFENCLRGIRNEGFGNCELVGNQFTMGGNAAGVEVPGSGFAHFDEGIILHSEMAGYIVEQNRFERTDDESYATYGIRASQTGGTDNQIYNNYLDHVTVGNLANGQNQNGDEFNPSGLRYECNNNEGNTEYDIISYMLPVPVPFAGIKPIQGALNLSAGNKFSHTDTPTDESDFYSDLAITYYHNDPQSSLNILYPEFHSAVVDPRNPISVAEHECPANYLLPDDNTDPPGHCVGCLTYSGYATAHSAHRAAFNSYQAKYNALIDGGNTARMLAMVDTATNAIRLRDTLLSYSPNLSTRVLDSVAADTTLLNDTMQYLVLKANAEAYTKTVSIRWNLAAAPPQWMRDSVTAARKNLTYRSYLLDTVTYHATAKQTAIYNILRLLTDDTAGFNINTYRVWLDSAAGIWAKRQMVNSYLQEGRFDTIETLLARYDTTVITNADDSIEFKYYKDYVRGYKDWIAADSSIMHLDSAHIVELYTLAEGDIHKKGTHMAHNAYNFFYGGTYFVPPYLPEEESDKKGDEDEFIAAVEAKPVQQQPDGKPMLYLYPNPAQNQLTIVYANTDVNAKLYIVDMVGEVIDTKLLPAGTGKIELNTISYQNGVYLARIEAGNRVLLKDKFVILK